LEIHAPLMPTVTNTSGPRQHTEATMAASAPPASVVFAALLASI